MTCKGKVLESASNTYRLKIYIVKWKETMEKGSQIVVIYKVCRPCSCVRDENFILVVGTN